MVKMQHTQGLTLHSIVNAYNLLPLNLLLQMMKPSSNPPPIVAVDAPSGWHVENGDESGQPWKQTAYLSDLACMPQGYAKGLQ